MIKLAILGSTGSIGTQCLKVLENLNKKNIEVVAMSCGHNFELFKKQVKKFKPKFTASLTNKENELNNHFTGEDGIKKIIELSKPDYIMMGISGSIGLKYSLFALDYCKRLCLANKETIVCGGDYFIKSAKLKKVEIIPVDSEHSSIFQTLLGDVKPKEIFLTASGGALRDYSYEEILNAKLEDVLNHPVWNMGKRITIDSASMVNKGLEVIEASYLFDFPENKIKTYICRNSMIHGGAIYSDGTMKFHIGKPDMKIPIAYSLTYPDRILSENNKVPLDKIDLNLLKIEKEKYPALTIAREICGIHSYQIAYNSADEEAVKMFLNNKIKFFQINIIISKTLEMIPKLYDLNYEDIFKIESMSRKIANEVKL